MLTINLWFLFLKRGHTKLKVTRTGLWTRKSYINMKNLQI